MRILLPNGDESFWDSFVWSLYWTLGDVEALGPADVPLGQACAAHILQAAARFLSPAMLRTLNHQSILFLTFLADAASPLRPQALHEFRARGLHSQMTRAQRSPSDELAREL